MKKRYKMYKSGKHWVVAPIVFLGLLGTVGLSTYDAHADELETVPATETQQKDASTLPTKEVVDTPVSEHNSKDEPVLDNNTQKTAETPVQNQADTQPEPEKNSDGVKQIETPKADEKAPEVAPTGNQALDDAVKDAQNNGVDVKEEPEKTVSSKEEADKDFKQQENNVKDTTNAQKEIDKTINDTVDKAKENGVDVKETEKQTYTDKQKAQEDAKKTSSRFRRSNQSHE